jgi:hypothetical protein
MLKDRQTAIRQAEGNTDMEAETNKRRQADMRQTYEYKRTDDRQEDSKHTGGQQILRSAADRSRTSGRKEDGRQTDRRRQPDRRTSDKKEDGRRTTGRETNMKTID